jgi:hypothetical protein
VFSFLRAKVGGARHTSTLASCIVLLLAQMVALGVDSSPNPELVQHVRWCIFHEGCRVFAPSAPSRPPGGVQRSISDLRQCFLATQRHNPSATALIKSATDSELQNIVSQAVKGIPSQFDLRGNFEWVAVHEGELGAFRRLDEAQQYEGIRAIYSARQAHNPNARNLLAAVADTTIHELVIQLPGSPPSDANFVTTRPEDAILIVNPNQLNATSIQATSLGSTAWQPATPDRKEGLTDWVQRLYGFKDSGLRQFVANAIAERNHRSGDFPLHAGETLLVPTLPVVPTAESDKTLFQVIDQNATTVGIANAAGQIVQPATPDILQHVGGWMVVSPRTANRVGPATSFFVATEDKKAVYAGPTFETTNLILADPANPCPSEPNLDVLAHVPTPNSAFATSDKLYVLDFFDPATAGPCPHGKKVLDVIQQVLSERGMGNLFSSNVIPIELDFFRHQTQLKSYIDEYISLQDSTVQPGLLAFVAKLQQRDLSTVKQFETPIIYVQAVYSHILHDKTASVVTSEFWGETSQFSLLPPPPIFMATSRPILLTAALDQPFDIETFPLEPIRSFYQGRHDFPLMVIGGLKRDGTQFGMTSTKGDGLSCLGYGNGWGDVTSCIRPSENGTSFGTPSVATMLFLARALWFSTAAASASVPMRDRFVHAVQLATGVPMISVAPGVPNLDWLGTGKSSVLIDSGNKALGVANFTGTLTFSYPDGSSVTSQFGSGDHQVSGLQKVEATSYVFDNTDKRWEQVNVTGLSVNITFADGTAKSILAAQSFFTFYKGALLL